MEFSTVQKVILWIIPLIFAITVHEVAHGWVASKLGDNTARLQGRLTLNSIAHIDPIGTLLIPALTLFIGGFMFGYAKPVPVNFGRLRNIRRDMVLVALAGPVANIIMALMWAMIAKIALPLSNAIFFMGISGISMNLALMILNLIPIPPLDGSRVVSSFLRGNLSRNYSRLEPYGFFILLALMALGVLSHIIMPALNYSFYLIANLFGLAS